MYETDRDRIIINEASRWRYCLGRQLKVLAGFTGQRAADRRFKKLISSGYLRRKRVIYGVPGLYFATGKAIEHFGIGISASSERLDQIYHDIAVVDTAIYFISRFEIEPSDIKTEKEIRKEFGFNQRTHQPDFTFSKDGKSHCAEVELTLKRKKRLEKNIRDNYMKYDAQLWIVPRNRRAIRDILAEMTAKYSNIEVIDREEVDGYIRQHTGRIRCQYNNV